ncbi:MAG: hypothetical protein J6X18_02655 [Bacteroidales bacterium]|nr:hypothetical protein [Bacteroidales bacterium]
MEENNFKEAKLLDIDSVRIVRYLVIDGYCVIYFRKITKDYNISVIKKEIGPDDILFPEPDGVDNAILAIVEKALKLSKTQIEKRQLNSEFLVLDIQKESLSNKKNNPHVEILLCWKEKCKHIPVFTFDKGKPINNMCDEDLLSKVKEVEFL